MYFLSASWSCNEVSISKSLRQSQRTHHKVIIHRWRCICSRSRAWAFQYFQILFPICDKLPCYENHTCSSKAGFSGRRKVVSQRRTNVVLAPLHKTASSVKVEFIKNRIEGFRIKGRGATPLVPQRSRTVEVWEMETAHWIFDNVNIFLLYLWLK